MLAFSIGLVHKGSNAIKPHDERNDMPFKPPATLANQIAEHISDLIIHARLKPGERIIEDKLARELGVSRAPLREAMRLIEKDGLVELMPRHGVRVAALTRAHVEDLYDILTELYAMLMRKLVDGITEDSTRRIEAAVKNLERSGKQHDVEGYYHAIFELGTVALGCVDVPLLSRIVTELWPAKRRVEYTISRP